MQTILGLAVLLLVTGAAVCESTDQTRVPGAKGSDVVLAVVDLIRGICIFPDDWHFIRRLAYVVSDDGEDSNTYRTGFDGGIWQINETQLETTKTAPELQAFRDAVYANLAVNWSSVQWSSLRQPLYSGLAAFLYVNFLSKSQGIPTTMEEQAVLWTSEIGTSANSFVKKAQLLKQTACVVQNPVDMVFALDSSASLSEGDFNRIKEFVVEIVSSLDVDVGKVQIAAVPFSSRVFSSFNLTAHASKNEVISAVKGIKYMAGGTHTNEALDFILQNILTGAAGARSGSSKVVVVLTDGRADNVEDTIRAAQTLKSQGANVFTVGIGDTVNKDELGKIASEPTCTHVRLVASVNDLSSLTADLQQIACRSAVALTPDNYLFSCNGSVYALLPSDVTKGTTLTLTSENGGVEVFGTVTPSLTPSSVQFNFHDESKNGVPVQLYIRDNTTVNLFFRKSPSGGCERYFSIKVTDGDKILPNIKNVTCLESQVVRDCSYTDLFTSSYLHLAGAGSEYNGLCQDGKVMVIPHPFNPTMFIFCNGSATLKGSCPPFHRFVSAIKRCVFEVAQPTTTASQAGVTKPYVTTTDQSATAVPTTSSSQTTEPSLNIYAFCTLDNIAKGLLTYPNPFNVSQFVKCYSYPVGFGAILSCPVKKYYSQKEMTCLYKEVQVNNTDGTSQVSHERNPCKQSPWQQYYPYPLDTHKFIQCDRFGDAFVLDCQLREVWVQEIMQCIPQGFKYETLPPGIIGKK